MKIQNYKFNKSSFLSVEKDLSLIVDKILKNPRLKKMIYYTTEDALYKPNLTEEQSISLIGNNIRLAPKVHTDSQVLTYVIIKFANFEENETNPEFRNNSIIIHIVCHYEQWLMRDMQLRPYRIASEFDSMLTNQKLSGIGEVKLDWVQETNLDDEFGVVTMKFDTIHGEEDKTHPLNPQNEELIYGVK